MIPHHVHISGIHHEKELATSRYEPHSLKFSSLSITSLEERVLQVRPDLLPLLTTVIAPNLLDGTQPELEDLFHADYRSWESFSFASTEDSTAKHIAHDVTWDKTYRFCAGMCAEVSAEVRVEGEWPITIALMSRANKLFGLTVELPTVNTKNFYPPVDTLPLAWNYADTLAARLGVHSLSSLFNKQESDAGSLHWPSSKVLFAIRDGIKLELFHRDSRLTPRSLYQNFPPAARGSQRPIHFDHHAPVEIILENALPSQERDLIRATSPLLCTLLHESELLNHAQALLNAEKVDKDSRRQTIAKHLDTIVSGEVVDLVVSKRYQSLPEKAPIVGGDLSFLDHQLVESDEPLEGYSGSDALPDPALFIPVITAENFIRTPFGEVSVSNFFDITSLGGVEPGRTPAAPDGDSTVLSLYPLNPKFIQTIHSVVPTADSRGGAHDLEAIAWEIAVTAARSRGYHLSKDKFLEALSYQRSLSSGFPFASCRAFLAQIQPGFFIRFSSGLF